MKNVIVTIIFCASFFPSIFAAEPNSNQSSFITRQQKLGGTGSAEVILAPKPKRKQSFPIFSDSFLKDENLHLSPRDRQQPGSREQLKPGYYKATKAPELSNPPVNK